MAFRMPMKQIGVKNMGFRVDLMEWSDKMDLIAIANEKGEIIIQRLNWQKVVVFPALAEGVKVKALAWQPGEAVIAAGYSNGKVSLLDIEKEDEIHSFTCESEIKLLNWKKTNRRPEIEKKDRAPITDDDFLSPLPNLNSFSSTSRKSEFNATKSFEKGTPNFLITSSISGQVLISVFGLLPCGTIKVADHFGDSHSFEIHDVRMSAKYDEIIVFVSVDGSMQLAVFENSILSEYATPLFTLAIKNGYITDTVNYTNETIQCIVEAWETALLEMDNKLTKYANSQPEGSISADFLELLMFGYPSEPLEQFLVRDLTEKGLKKLANSIELSYSTIQKLVIRPLHSAAINLVYYLNKIVGLSKHLYFYGDLLDETSTQDAMRNAGSFLIKIFELQQTISQSVSDYKTFWCWLYMAIIRLMDENVPDDLASVSQQDITYLAEFLNNFDDCIVEREDGSVAKRKFNLERVGQYLEDADLQIPVKKHDENHFLSENECFRNSPLIYPHHKNHSLIQDFNIMKQSIAEVFRRPNNRISETFQLKFKMRCTSASSPEYPIHTTFISNNTIPDILIATSNSNQLMMIEMPARDQVKVSKIHVANGQCQYGDMNNILVKHMQLYNDKTLSLLVRGIFEGRQVDYFVQLDLRKWLLIGNKHEIRKQMDFSELGNALCEFVDSESFSKLIDGNSCTKIAVSGSRKVASVLSDNSRKIRIYEMEMEDEDDEMEPSINLFTSREIP